MPTLTTTTLTNSVSKRSFTEEHSQGEQPDTPASEPLVSTHAGPLLKGRKLITKRSIKILKCIAFVLASPVIVPAIILTFAAHNILKGCKLLTTKRIPKGLALALASPVLVSAAIVTIAATIAATIVAFSVTAVMSAATTTATFAVGTVGVPVAFIKDYRDKKLARQASLLEMSEKNTDSNDNIGSNGSVTI